jgi:hypothetical protein
MLLSPLAPSWHDVTALLYSISFQFVSRTAGYTRLDKNDFKCNKEIKHTTNHGIKNTELSGETIFFEIFKTSFPDSYLLTDGQAVGGDPTDVDIKS